MRRPRHVLGLAFPALLVAFGIMFFASTRAELSCPEGQTEDWAACCVCATETGPNGTCIDCYLCTVCTECNPVIHDCPAIEIGIVVPPGGPGTGGGGGGGGGGPPGGPAPPPPDADGNGVIDCYKGIQSGTTPDVEGTTMDVGTAYPGGENSWDPCHRGLDILCTPGTPILAPCSGVLQNVPGLQFGGNVAVIDTGAPPPAGTNPAGSGTADMKCSVGHLDSFSAPNGTSVTAGVTEIGKCGQSGSATFPHAHLEVSQAGTPNDGAGHPCGSGPQANSGTVVHDPVQTALSGDCP